MSHSLNKLIKRVICPYCNKPAKLVKGSVIYPKLPHLASSNYYLCRPCNAYVGCHGNTTNPLGNLANARLRKARLLAHDAFDAIWKRKLLSRSEAYKELANYMELHPSETHIGMFDERQCELTVVFAKRLLNELQTNALKEALNQIEFT